MSRIDTDSGFLPNDYLAVVWCALALANSSELGVALLKEVYDEDLKQELLGFYNNQPSEVKPFFCYECLGLLIPWCQSYYLIGTESPVSVFKQSFKHTCSKIQELFEENSLSPAALVCLDSAIEDYFNRTILPTQQFMEGLTGVSLLSAIKIPESDRLLSDSGISSLEEVAISENFISPIATLKLYPVILTHSQALHLKNDVFCQKLLIAWLCRKYLKYCTTPAIFIQQWLFNDFSLTNMDNSTVVPLSYANRSKAYHGIGPSDFMYIVGTVFPTLNCLDDSPTPAQFSAKSLKLSNVFAYYECIDKYFSATDDLKESEKLKEILQELALTVSADNWKNVACKAEEALMSAHACFKITKTPSFEGVSSQITSFDFCRFFIKGSVDLCTKLKKDLSNFCKELIEEIPELKNKHMGPIFLATLCLSFEEKLEYSTTLQKAYRVLNNSAPSNSSFEVFEKEQAATALDFVMNVPFCSFNDLMLWSVKKRLEFEVSQSLYLILDAHKSLSSLTELSAEISLNTEKQELEVILCANLPNDKSKIGVVNVPVKLQVESKIKEIAGILTTYGVSPVVDKISSKLYFSKKTKKAVSKNVTPFRPK